MSISPISPLNVGNLESIGSSNKPAASNSLENVTKSFSDMLDSLNKSQLESDSLVQQLSTGGSVDLHQVMIGMEENDVNFRVALAIRDKLVEAYREVMRMQV